jgi:hypothetical protein
VARRLTVAALVCLAAATVAQQRPLESERVVYRESADDAGGVFDGRTVLIAAAEFGAR